MTGEAHGASSSAGSVVSEAQAHDERMFPTLSAAHVARIAAIGHERRLANDERLWDEHVQHIPFFVVLEGTVVILAGSPERIVVVHEPGGFTGDVDMLSGRGSAVHARARGATRVIEIARKELRTLLETDAELGEILVRAFLARRVALLASGVSSLVIVGSHAAPGTLLLQQFLQRNGRPYEYVDVDRDPSMKGLLGELHVGADDYPVVLSGHDVVRKPTIRGLADCLGLDDLGDGGVHDLVVVGAGPAGLAAAVYAASEGLRVLVLEAYAPGGQAGSSSRIENYLGFPTGISGNDLAGRAFVQAEKFGATVAVARSAARLDCSRRPYVVRVDDEVVETRAAVIATGAEYRKVDCLELARFEGVGVYHAATALETRVCEGAEVIIVGGGNSAGQAALFCSRSVERVHMLVRGPRLAESMSEYLIRRIERTANIDLRTDTQIVGVEGEAHLERVTWLEKASGRRVTKDVRHVFLMTGATPNTGWLEGCVALDAHGFVKTGIDLDESDVRAARWPLERRPYPYETSLSGVFAVGDVRAGSVKRVAAAVGEGSGCVQFVHKALAERAELA